MDKTELYLGRSLQINKKLCYLLTFIIEPLVLIAYMVRARYK